MKVLQPIFKSSAEHYETVAKPFVSKFLALKNYLLVMFPEYEFTINPESTQAILNHPKDTDYVVINLDKDYMINSVSYYSNEVVSED